MKRLFAFCAVAVMAAATAFAERWEVHINVPGGKPIVTVAEVDMRHSPILTITADWGDVYVAHFSNVVLVRRARGR